jgi:hypothetical protein
LPGHCVTCRKSAYKHNGCGGDFENTVLLSHKFFRVGLNRNDLKTDDIILTGAALSKVLLIYSKNSTFVVAN